MSEVLGLVLALAAYLAITAALYVVLQPVIRRRQEREHFEREAKLEALRAQRVRPGALYS